MTNDHDTCSMACGRTTMGMEVGLGFHHESFFNFVCMIMYIGSVFILLRTECKQMGYVLFNL